MTAIFSFLVIVSGGDCKNGSLLNVGILDFFCLDQNLQKRRKHFLQRFWSPGRNFYWGFLQARNIQAQISLLLSGVMCSNNQMLPVPFFICSFVGAGQHGTNASQENWVSNLFSTDTRFCVFSFHFSPLVVRTHLNVYFLQYEICHWGTQYLGTRSTPICWHFPCREGCRQALRSLFKYWLCLIPTRSAFVPTNSAALLPTK